MLYRDLILILTLIFLSINQNEIFKEKIDKIYSNNNLLISILGIILIILLLIIVKMIQKKIKINIIYIIIISLLFSLIIIEIKLIPNYKINRCIKINDLYNNLNIGDIVVFRSYSSPDIFNFLIFRIFTSLLSSSNKYFSHIGIIVKINNIPYIMECNQEKLYCSYSKHIKSGPAITKIDNRIKNYLGSVYIIKTNLYKYINPNTIIPFFEKYKKCNYLQDLLICTTFINKFLYKNNITNKESKIILPSAFFNKKFYNIDFKINNIYKIIP